MTGKDAGDSRKLKSMIHCCKPRIQSRIQSKIILAQCAYKPTVFRGVSSGNNKDPFLNTVSS